MITYRQITTADPEYQWEKELRTSVLRAPLGLRLSDQDVRDENKQIHIVALSNDGRMVGCVLVAFIGDAARIRQMAVTETHQGKGIGTELLRRAEQAIVDHNMHTAILHARVLVRGFYERRGYLATSGIFTEVTVPHIEMRKELAAE